MKICIYFSILIPISQLISCSRIDPFGHRHKKRDYTPYDQCLYQGLAGNDPESCELPTREYCEMNAYSYEDTEKVCLSEGYCLNHDSILNSESGVCE